MSTSASASLTRPQPTTPELSAEEYDFPELSMTASQRQCCLSSYRRWNRTPSEQEIRLLDAILSCYRNLPGSLAIAEYQTTDKQAAEIYASILREDRALSRAPLPMPTLSGLAQSATRIVQEAGIPLPAPTDDGYSRFAWLEEGDFAWLPLYGLQAEWKLSGELSPAVLTSLRPEHSVGRSGKFRRIRRGDLFSFVSPMPDTSVADAAPVLAGLLRQDNTRKAIRQWHTVPAGAAVPVLLSMGNGWDADFSFLLELSKKPEPSTPASLAHTPAGWMIVMDEENTRELLRTTREAGLSFVTVARATSDHFLTVRQSPADTTGTPQMQERICFSVDFLRALAESGACRISAFPPSGKTVTGDLPSVSSLPDTLLTETADSSLSRILLSADARGNPDVSPRLPSGWEFLHRTYRLPQGLQARQLQEELAMLMTEATVHGGDVRETGLALSWQLPDLSCLPEVLSSLLGVHRQITEWQIPTLPPHFFHREGVEATLSVCLFSHRAGSPCRALTEPGRPVSLCTPDPKAAPALGSANHRQLLAYLSHHVGRGNISAIRAKRDATAADVLDDMVTDSVCLAAHQDDEAWRVYLSPHPVSVVVEHNGALTAGEPLGTTEDDTLPTAGSPSQENSDATQPAVVVCDTSAEAVNRQKGDPSSVPRILLPTAPGMADPAPLISSLRAKGASVTCCRLSAHPTDAEINRFSADLPKTDLLFLCSDGSGRRVPAIDLLLQLPSVQRLLMEHSSPLILAIGGSAETLTSLGWLGDSAAALSWRPFPPAAHHHPCSITRPVSSSAPAAPSSLFCCPLPPLLPVATKEQLSMLRESGILAGTAKVGTSTIVTRLCRENRIFVFLEGLDPATEEQLLRIRPSHSD